jgi:hypothetical protein
VSQHAVASVVEEWYWIEVEGKRELIGMSSATVGVYEIWRLLASSVVAEMLQEGWERTRKAGASL